MNGSVMPLAGIRCRFTAMLIADCSAEQDGEAGGGKAREGVVVAHGARQRADHDEGIERDQHQAERDAEFLRRHREHEVGVALRQQPLDRALARAAAEPAAAHEAFGGDVDIEGVAGGRIEEALDAARHVRHRVIGRRQADRRQRRQCRTPRSAACRP